ncbi:hypothetical protein H6P81_012873 [Aristolochia fimbriata]|uniref:Uncharacterized protein n=1 Tax=Aristolochia fimbriata TaxID=158543 RepID=A0AAV7ED07_ARIFI|nr:hypothetical protein H6P81_012873 [Aristolochia fimbriata]
MYTAGRRSRTTYRHQEYVVNHVDYTPNGYTYTEQFETKQGLHQYPYAPSKVDYEGKGYGSYPHHYGKYGPFQSVVEQVPPYSTEERRSAYGKVFLPVKMLQAWARPARVKPGEAVVVVQEPQGKEKVEENGYNVDEAAGEFLRKKHEFFKRERLLSMQAKA